MNIDLRHGDCLEIMKDIPDKSIDMILCDLPYGTTACKWDVIIPFDKLWEQYHRIIKDNGAIVLFGSEPFSTKLRNSNLKMYRYDWVWNKIRGTGHLLAKKRPMMCTENISVFYKKMPVYNPQMRKRDKPRMTINSGKGEVYGSNGKPYIGEVLNEKFPINLLTFSKSDMTKNNYHPTQKPTELLEYLIKTYSNENALVLDNCMGSGSTGVACINTNRNFIGIEKDKNYFEIAKKRIEEKQVIV